MTHISNWSVFWTQFAQEAYDYTSLLPENKLLLQAVASYVGTNKRVLDAGCGTGNLIMEMFEGNRIVGLDSSPGMLKVARRKNSKNSCITYSHGDVTKLPFPDESFDVVTSVNVLYHLDNPAKALREAHRVLKTKGVFIAASPLRGANLNPSFMEKVMKDCEQGKVDPKKFETLRQYNEVIFQKGGMKFLPTFEEMERYLTDAGFKATHQQKIYYGMDFLCCAQKITTSNSQQ